MAKSKKTKSAKTQSAIHLLDVGEAQYGDCLLCEVGAETILIDGGHKEDLLGSAGHPAIPDQIRELLSVPEGQPIRLSLIVVSHAHDDHVGCLPEMVERGIVEAEWALMVDPDLAWSSTATDSPTAADRLLAALREEPRIDLDSRDAYDAFARDASKLQGRYRAMIARLKRDGTHVVLHGKTPLGKLEDRFANIGLQILGPSKAHLKACAEIIRGVGRDFVRDATQALATDADPSVIYRQLQALWQIGRAADSAADPVADGGATDAMRSLGPVVNLQSSAFVLNDGAHRFLFSGDLQLEKPEVSSEAIASSIESMLAEVAEHAPYDFVKLGHHGSYNAFGDRVLASIGDESRNFGICTGANSLHHPSRKALELLKDRASDITWARTDKNGAVTFSFSSSGANVSTSRGRLNDTTPPSSDEVAERPVSSVTPAAPVSVVMQPAAVGTPEVLPIEIHVPYVPGTDIEVSLTLKIGASAPVSGQERVIPQRAPAPDLATFKLAGDRELPPLLFVTNTQKLAANVGSDVVAAVVAALHQAEQVVVDVAGIDGDTLAIAKAAAHLALQKDRKIEGVVILGGFDVIPAERRDVFPGCPDEDRDLDGDDGFVVWSDAGYADCDEDGLAELPVSRIPDGHSPHLFLAALSTPGTPLKIRHGVRNTARPFADRVYTHLNGADPMLRSDPHNRRLAPDYRVQGDHVYLMLHGDYEDATRYWGERLDGSLVEALDIEQIQLDPGTVVFTGCCWGGLVVEEPAGVLRTPQPTPRTPGNSIALRALSQGALAFVGCTGMHYSPTDESIDTASAPLHDGFWRRVRGGMAPAEALFAAKKEFIADPNRAKSPQDRKIFEQFTVLGLGW